MLRSCVVARPRCPPLRSIPVPRSFSQAAHRKSSCAIYSDRTFVVLNKPSGLPAQLGKDAFALREILLDLNDIEPVRENQLPHPYPVHRLDKGTTGVFICGRTQTAVSYLASQFKARKVEKEYLALVRGSRASLNQLGGSMVNWWSGKNGYVTVSNEKIDSESKLAITFWELLGSSPIAPLSLVLLRPHTGFKHQLRAQLNYMGVPILGDKRYSTVTHTSILTAIGNLDDKLYLHASSASFDRYRRTNTRRRFSFKIVAPLPDYFKKACEKFQIHLDKQYIEGGVFVDNERVESGVIEDVGGRWLL